MVEERQQAFKFYFKDIYEDVVNTEPPLTLKTSPTLSALETRLVAGVWRERRSFRARDGISREQLTQC